MKKIIFIGTILLFYIGLSGQAISLKQIVKAPSEGMVPVSGSNLYLQYQLLSNLCSCDDSLIYDSDADSLYMRDGAGYYSTPHIYTTDDYTYYWEIPNPHKYDLFIQQNTTMYYHKGNWYYLDGDNDRYNELQAIEILDSTNRVFRLNLDHNGGIVKWKDNNPSDSTLLNSGYGTYVYETTPNNWVVEADTNEVVTPYDLNKMVSDSSYWNANGNSIYNANSGNVGIGTSSPKAKLHSFLAGSGSSDGPTGTVLIGQNSTAGSNAYLTLVGAYNSEAGIVFTDESNAYKGKIGYNNNTEHMYFNIDGSEKMRINSAGNVGIGTNSPNKNLELYSTSGSTLRISNGTANDSFGIEFYGGGMDSYMKHNAQTGVFKIASGRSVGWGGSIKFATDVVNRMELSSLGVKINSLTSGLVKSTNGILQNAVAGTDYIQTEVDGSNNNETITNFSLSSGGQLKITEAGVDHTVNSIVYGGNSSGTNQLPLWSGSQSLTSNNLLSGLALLTAGSVSTITDNSANWNTAYTHSINDADISINNEIEVVDEVYNSGNFNGGITSAVSQDDFYDYQHIADTDDDGKINIVDLSNAGFVKTDINGNLSVDANTYQTSLTTGNLTESVAGLQFDNTRQVIGGAAALSLTAGYVIPTTTEETNWNTAYGWGNHANAGYLTTDQYWTGTSTNLNAATGRTSLGGTTIGQSMFTLTNPSAITFPRFNADNTVTALSAANFRTAIGAGTFTLPSLMDGSVLFSNGSTISQDNTNFFWDNTNKRLGLGTTNPGSILHLYKQNSGAGANYITLEQKNTSNNYTHTTKLYTETSSGGLGRTVLTAASNTTNSTQGQFDIFTEDEAFYMLRYGNAVSGANNALSLYNLAGGERIRFHTAGTAASFIKGALIIDTLSGSGNRMVIAASNGNLSTQAIPTSGVTGTGATNQLTKWTSSNTIGGITNGTGLLYNNGSGGYTWVTGALPALTDGKIWVGNTLNAASERVLSGDATMDNMGVVTVTNDSHTHSASTIIPDIVSSVENVANDGGNIDLVGDGISITGDDANNKIDIAFDQIFLRAYATDTTACASAWRKIEYNSESYDNGGFITNSGGNYSIQVPSVGVYEIETKTKYTMSTVGGEQLIESRILINGSVVSNDSNSSYLITANNDNEIKYDKTIIRITNTSHLISVEVKNQTNNSKIIQVQDYPNIFIKKISN